MNVFVGHVNCKDCILLSMIQLETGCVAVLLAFLCMEKNKPTPAKEVMYIRILQQIYLTVSASDS